MDASHPLWLNLVLLAIGVLPVVLLTGTLLFVAIERPFMAWRPGYSSQIRGGSVDTSR